MIATRLRKLSHFHFLVEDRSAILCLLFSTLCVSVVSCEHYKQPIETKKVEEAKASKEAKTAQDVILISVDTLRADHLGCYGDENAKTPHLDKLASESVLFEQAFTPVPLTLPAHVSMLTGVYPATHGVHDNGEALAASFPTVVQKLHSAGFETAAFIGSFILDRRFGLAKGFDTYSGNFHLNRFEGADPGTIQIRGDHVESAAERWIAKHHSHRFFAFVHFYDLHGPYLLPQPWRSKFRKHLYDGEIAYVDDLIGRLWARIQREGLADRTLLIITGDHGEGLGDHGERNHGFFLYSSTTHVPLIVRFPDHRFAGQRVKSVVSLIDIAPTICVLAGVPSLSTFEGQSLTDAISANPSSALPVYSETLYPYFHFHSAPLYAVENNRFTYIEAPRSELYDRTKDPNELHNLVGSDDELAGSLREELLAWINSPRRTAPKTRQPPPDVVEQLRSLGYVGGSPAANALPPPDLTLPDPKDQIALYRHFQDALELENRREYRAAVERLDRILADDSKIFSAQIEAGLARQYLHQDFQAIKNFEAALRLEPHNALAYYDLGISLGNLRRYDKAEQELTLATRYAPWYSQAYLAKGLDQAHQGKFHEAIASMDAAIRIDPSDFDSFLNRGNIEGILGEWAKARADIERAISIEPDSAQARHALGTLEFHTGNLEGALRQYEEALRLDPRSSTIHSDLGLLYSRLGRVAEARTEFKRSLALDPTNREAQRGLQILRRTAAD